MAYSIRNWLELRRVRPNQEIKNRESMLRDTETLRMNLQKEMKMAVLNSYTHTVPLSMFASQQCLSFPVVPLVSRQTDPSALSTKVKKEASYL